MTFVDAHDERLARISALGLELMELARTLKREYSNYGFIAPEEEAVFTELWKGVIDLEDALEHHCHGMPEEASKHYSEVTGYISIPTFSGEEIAAGYDFRKYPWHYARRMRKIRDKHYDVLRIDGALEAESAPKLTAVKSLATQPVPVPEGVNINYEVKRPDGWFYEFYADGKLLERVKTRENGQFAVPVLGIEHVHIGWAADAALAPDIPKGARIIADEDVRQYDGAGVYIFDKGSGPFDIAELKQDPAGGYIYISDKKHPVKLEDLSSLKFLGKVRYVLKRNKAAEERPVGNIADLDPEDRQCEEESIDSGI